MKVNRSTDPTVDPVTSALVEERLSIESGFDSNVITELIDDATTQVEYDTGLSVMQQTWTLNLDNWPDKETIWLPMGPLDTSADGVESFTYTDSSGGTQTLTENTHFRVSEAGDNEIKITPIDSWPSDVADCTDYAHPIKIVYDTGRSTALGWQKNAVLTKVAYLHKLGEDKYMNEAYESIIRKHKDKKNYHILNG